jgi:hypothetical protein|tara:strand:- start:24386 stop:25129 length:744 start_codon:yes stop_codon:yes gene_type:complete
MANDEGLIDYRGRYATNTTVITSETDDRTNFKNKDWRARIRPKKGGEDWAYGLVDAKGNPQKSILQPLKDRGGIVFPYTPNLYLQASTEYNEASQHGSNYPFYTYINSRPPTLPLQGSWTANTTEEAQYLLAVFHFLRSVTKGFFGDTSVEAGTYGTPPPVMLFEYLGEFGFNRVPVVIRSYNFQFPDGVDYVPVKYKGANGETTTYMPVETDIMIEMAPQYTYKKLRKKFDLQGFSSGKSYKDGFI